MAKGVAITGMGIISSIGNSVEENYHSLIENKIGISRISNISTVHADVIKVVKSKNQR
jgi:3-oxoacyl-[acyl-carrier-protein] synthase-1